MLSPYADLLGSVEQSGTSTATVTITPASGQDVYISGLMAAYSEPRVLSLNTAEVTGTGTALAKLTPLDNRRLMVTRLSAAFYQNTTVPVTTARMLFLDAATEKGRWRFDTEKTVIFDPPFQCGLSTTPSLHVELGISGGYVTSEIGGFFEADGSGLKIKDGTTQVAAWEVNEPKDVTFDPPIRFAAGNTITISLDPRGTTELSRISVFGLVR